MVFSGAMSAWHEWSGSQSGRLAELLDYNNTGKSRRRSGERVAWSVRRLPHARVFWEC